MYRTLPTTLSLELRMQSYDNFLNPPNFRRSFFREPQPLRLTPIIYRSTKIAFARTPIILYIGVPRSHSRGYLLLYIVSVRTWDLNKVADKQLSNHQNLLTTQGSPDASEDPFFWVASAKVIQLPESTKLSTNFFRRISGHPLRRKLILTWKSEGSEQIGVLVPLVTLANSQRLTANFLGLGKFNAGLLQ